MTFENISSGIISEYRGATRRAVVDFENPVGAGSHYSIANDKGLGMGYKVIVFLNARERAIVPLTSLLTR